MKWRFPLVLSLFLSGHLLTSSPIFAETEIGNGGDALLCKKNGIFTYESFDAFEARELWELAPEFGPDKTDPLVMAKYAVERLRALDPSRTELLLKKLNDFNDEARFLNDVELKDVQDTDSQIIPQHCQLRQLIIQYKNPKPRMPRYIVDANIWQALDATSKAYMLLHEALYYEAIVRGARDSRTTRIFNAFLASKTFESWGPENYQRFLDERLHTSFPAVVVHGGFHLQAGSAGNQTTNVKEWLYAYQQSACWRTGWATAHAASAR